MSRVQFREAPCLDGSLIDLYFEGATWPLWISTLLEKKFTLNPHTNHFERVYSRPQAARMDELWLKSIFSRPENQHYSVNNIVSTLYLQVEEAERNKLEKDDGEFPYGKHCCGR